MNKVKFLFAIMCILSLSLFQSCVDAEDDYPPQTEVQQTESGENGEINDEP